MFAFVKNESYGNESYEERTVTVSPVELVHYNGKLQSKIDLSNEFNTNEQEKVRRPKRRNTKMLV